MAEIDINNIIEAISSIPQTDVNIYIDGFVQQKIDKTSDYSYMYRNGFSFFQYKSLKDTYKLVDEVKNDPKKVADLSKNYSKDSFVNWEQLTLERKGFGTYDEFMDYVNSDNPNHIETKNVVFSLLENIKTFVNIGGLYKNDRIIPTEDKRGFFDFSLASQGLYRPIEFYSEDLKKEIEGGIIQNPFLIQGLPNGVINPNLVNAIGSGSQKTFIYNYNNKNYLCERRQRGTTSVFDKFSNECELGSLSSGIIVPIYKNRKEKVFNGKGKDKLKYASSNKKSYLIFQKKKENVKYVDIFCAFNFIGSSNGTRVLALLPALLVTGALEEYGIQVRLNVQRLGSDKSVHTTISIPLKEYNEPLSLAVNRILNVIGEEQAGQTLLGFLKGVAQTTTTQAPQLSRLSTTFTDVEYMYEDYYVAQMQRYKNWAEANKDKPFVDTQVTNPNFQIGIPTLSTAFAGEEVEKLEYDNIMLNLPDVLFRFYYYMDFLAIEMLSMQEFTKEVVDRFVSDENFRRIYKVPKDREKLKVLIRKYILGIITEKYFPVNNYEYADTVSQTEEKDKQREAKISFLDESLNSLL